MHRVYQKVHTCCWQHGAYTLSCEWIMKHIKYGSKENMGVVQKAIEEITHLSDRFPEEAFRIITANKEEAIPYLRKAVSYAVSEGRALNEDYQLHFCALYLLGEFQDRESFPKLVELVSLPDGAVDYLLGDCITTDLKDILYNTYDGEIEFDKSIYQ